MRFKLMALAATFGLCGFVCPASAAIVNVTVTGTVTGDTDLTGEFGMAGGYDNLVGDAYTARYVFDTSIGATYSSPTVNYAYGPLALSTATPVVSASVTVNAHIQRLFGADLGEIIGYQDGSYGTQYYAAQDVNESYASGIAYEGRASDNNLGGYDPTIPATITVPFTFYPNVNDGDDFGAFYDFGYDFNNVNIIDTEVDADITKVVLSSGVPEPGTWALMVIGFAGLGFAGYRKYKFAERGSISE